MAHRLRRGKLWRFRGRPRGFGGGTDGEGSWTIDDDLFRYSVPDRLNHASATRDRREERMKDWSSDIGNRLVTQGIFNFMLDG
jgi:hypothetical protein